MFLISYFVILLLKLYSRFLRLVKIRLLSSRLTMTFFTGLVRKRRGSLGSSHVSKEGVTDSSRLSSQRDPLRQRLVRPHTCVGEEVGH